MTDVSAHGNKGGIDEAKKIMDMGRMVKEEGVNCFVVMAGDAPLAWWMSPAVRALASEAAECHRHLFPETCLQDNWTHDIAKSEAFQSEYRVVSDPDDMQKWPKGLSEEDRKLYGHEKLLVPEYRLPELCEAWNQYMVHLGVTKQALDMQQPSKIEEIGLYNGIKQFSNHCSVCQACNPDNWNVKREAQRTPIPDQSMKSVAMDEFFM